jgi:hypothetical protein
MELSGQLQASAALLPGKEPPVPIRQDDVWVPELVWTMLPLPGLKTPSPSLGCIAWSQSFNLNAKSAHDMVPHTVHTVQNNKEFIKWFLTKCRALHFKHTLCFYNI